MTTTKKELQEYLKGRLATDKDWALRALLLVVEFQSDVEYEMERTKFRNGMGFNSSDGEILTSIAKQYQKKGWISDKQLFLVQKRIPKYWEQVMNLSNMEKLELAYLKSIKSGITITN